MEENSIRWYLRPAPSYCTIVEESFSWLFFTTVSDIEQEAGVPGNCAA